MLGIGLVLFCMRAMRPSAIWNERLLSIGFWSINVGLLAMVVLSVFPIGLVQTWASVEHGYAYARSPELMQLPYMKTLRWMRIPGDTLFAVGAVAIIAFVFGVGRQSKPRSTAAAPGGVRTDADPVLNH
jgi:nitric oxide reductase subunit B